MVRDVKDFPVPGIVFKDITPILQSPNACKVIIEEFSSRLSVLNIDCVAGVESRGFIFGPLLAQKWNVPFVPIRKKGKLPFDKVSQEFTLEYGSDGIEIHKDAFKEGSNVFVHDDLLATGGTAVAACQLVKKLNAIPIGLGFIIELDFLKGRKVLDGYSKDIVSLIKF